MSRQVEISAVKCFADGSWWDAEAREYIDGVFTRRVEGDGGSEHEAIADALKALAREVYGDARGISDRCGAIEHALSWWSELVVPKARCSVCLERVPADDILMGECGDCRERLRLHAEEMERREDARWREYDRREDANR